jgi:hypothetical protein
MKKLDLKVLEDGYSTGLSVRNGGFLAEAASICLYHHSHPSEVYFPVEGALQEHYQLRRLVTDEQSRNSYTDPDEAAQFGAMGIAVALIYDQKGWKVKRSWKGTGFDYWVGEQQGDYPFQNSLRMEVSGDFEGTDAELRHRLKIKLNQTTRSDSLNLPACAVVVEFSNPKSLTGSR